MGVIETQSREERLRTTQRKMLRKIWGAQRKMKGEDTATPEAEEEAEPKSDQSSSISSNSDGSSRGKGEDAGNVKESWVEWLQRTARNVEWAMEKGKVVDWVAEQRRRKWRWAGHVMRRTDSRWSRRMVQWLPVGGRRRPGRPTTRWEDALESFANRLGFRWENEALDQKDWKRWEATFVETGR